ncbi:MAG TPA: serine hydroxymethyltransferase [Bacillota bacterium]|jgi:glycine hydroxymethyltransferase|nr:serine hydroxymethyltransferase [Bacillota bacterium]HOJ84793.1 serine hydroxymethyltransferase [Bacillota bacterium]HOL14966.1 serine hydroxymethyltransferase [Bacillota bacterium]HPZ11156.1 serine hydroxymethyltransferase [Bacillota bacterium]HQE09230.1 serine hydroxymethyltransferase [Bacillota bacterium]
MNENDHLSELRRIDPEVAAAIEGEERRQQDNLELIASENITGRAVLQAQGSVLTNKYAEGYPGARYYGGCRFVDEVERLACTRAQQLFKADHANVQPHSGSSANLAVYLAFLNPGDRILGMDLAHGGHLTHGSPVNITGRYFEVHSYGVEPGSGLLDMDEVRLKALQVRPKLIIAGATAYPRRIDFASFQDIAREVGAILMVDMAHIAGLVAAGLHPSPLPHAAVVTTTTHKTLRGPRGGMILCHREHASLIDNAVFPGLQGGPLMHVIAAKAVALKEAQLPEFAAYQSRVLENTQVLAASLIEAGFDLVTGGSDTHLVLVDLRSKNITGLEAEQLLEKIGITANKNSIPFDRRSPRVTSGLRLGTPAVTSRGMGGEQIRTIAQLINEAITYRTNEKALERLRRRVNILCQEFPVKLS